MATERTTVEFERVSRIRGSVFEYLTFGASVVGILALAVLLAYVTIDAFDLTNASSEWLLTYFLTFVVPLVGFCLYSANDRELTRRTVVALGGGLVATAAGFAAIEALVRPIPRLTWPLVYLFVVAVPVTAYVTLVGSREPIGRAGFSLLGRLIGGVALGLSIPILFVVFDARLWFLAYTLGVLPAALVYAYGLRHPSSSAPEFVVPVGVGGIVSAAILRQVLRTYPTTPLIYAWAVVIPLSAAGAVLVAGRGSRIAATAVGGFVLAVAVGGGLAADAAGLSTGPAVLVLATASVTTVVYLHRIFESGEGQLGLALPVLLGAGVVMGTVIVELWGVPGPDPWLDASFVTSSPSRRPADAGLYPAIVGSVVIIALVAVLSFGLGVGTAVLLEEYTVETGLVGAITRVITINIANLAAVPSVVYGLLGLGLFANLLGFGFGTAVTAALTLSLLILPITVISAQEAIRSVPDDLRQGSYAMGATRWQTTKNVVLPEAFPGILTGTILALGRAIGETAPLIMIGAATTVFNAPDSVWSKFSAMPMQIFAWSSFPQEEFRYGVVAAGVVTLLLVLLGMNATAIVLRNRSERGV